MITIVPKTTTEQPVEILAVDSATAGKMLGVSTRTVRNLAKAGKIVCRKCGWRNLYVVESLKKFLEDDNTNANE